MNAWHTNQELAYAVEFSKKDIVKEKYRKTSSQKILNSDPVFFFLITYQIMWQFI